MEEMKVEDDDGKMKRGDYGKKWGDEKEWKMKEMM
jgi:hypothetical protein